jgi:NADH-quinone oxidoreductase subunit A
MEFSLKEFIGSNLFYIIIFTVAGFALGVSLIVFSWLAQKLFGIQKPSRLKQEVYECGMKPLEKSQIQFDIKYYLFALMFIIFDVEFVFLIPWALSFSIPTTAAGKLFLFGEAFLFIGVLGFGLFYAWKKNALEWD